jgi:uncharacterized protein (UPF0335 family)
LLSPAHPSWITENHYADLIREAERLDQEKANFRRELAQIERELPGPRADHEKAVKAAHKEAKARRKAEERRRAAEYNPEGRDSPGSFSRWFRSRR